MSERRFNKLIQVFLKMKEDLSKSVPVIPLHYNVNLRTYPNQHRLEADVEVTLKRDVDDLPRVLLYLGIPGMNVFSVHGVYLNGEPCRFTYRTPLLEVGLGQSAKDEIVRIRVSYSGHVSSPKNYVGPQGTELMGEGLWYPLAAFPGPRFSVRAVTDTPDHESTGFCGAPIATRKVGGRTVTQWESDSWVNSLTFVSGPFATWEEPSGITSIRSMVQKGYEEWAPELARQTKAALETGRFWFGPLPLSMIYLVQPRRKTYGEYAHMPLIVYAKSNLSEAMSPQKKVSLFEATAHELGHFWWGNVVSSDSIKEGWLSEGFADFTKLLALENQYGPNERQRMLSQMIERVRNLGEVPPLATIPFTHPAQGQIVRRKGGLFLQFLRQHLGDERMRHFTTTLFAKYSGKFMTTEDFINTALESVGGDLQSFLRHHLYERTTYKQDEQGFISDNQ